MQMAAEAGDRSGATTLQRPAARALQQRLQQPAAAAQSPHAWRSYAHPFGVGPRSAGGAASAQPSATHPPTMAAASTVDRLGAPTGPSFVDYTDVSRNCFYRPAADGAFETSDLSTVGCIGHLPNEDSCTYVSRSAVSAMNALPVGTVLHPEITSSRFRALSDRSAAPTRDYSTTRKVNEAERKWGSLTFYDREAIEHHAFVTKLVLEQRQGFAQLNRNVTFPTHVTDEARTYATPRHGPKWEMFDGTRHLEYDAVQTMNRVQAEQARRKDAFEQQQVARRALSGADAAPNRQSGDDGDSRDRSSARAHMSSDGTGDDLVVVLSQPKVQMSAKSLSQTTISLATETRNLVADFTSVVEIGGTGFQQRPGHVETRYAPQDPEKPLDSRLAQLKDEEEWRRRSKLESGAAAKLKALLRGRRSDRRGGQQRGGSPSFEGDDETDPTRRKKGDEIDDDDAAETNAAVPPTSGRPRALPGLGVDDTGIVDILRRDDGVGRVQLSLAEQAKVTAVNQQGAAVFDRRGHLVLDAQQTERLRQEQNESRMKGDSGLATTMAYQPGSPERRRVFGLANDAPRMVFASSKYREDDAFEPTRPPSAVLGGMEIDVIMDVTTKRQIAAATSKETVSQRIEKMKRHRRTKEERLHEEEQSARLLAREVGTRATTTTLDKLGEGIKFRAALTHTPALMPYFETGTKIFDMKSTNERAVDGEDGMAFGAILAAAQQRLVQNNNNNNSYRGDATLGSSILSAATGPMDVTPLYAARESPELGPARTEGGSVPPTPAAAVMSQQVAGMWGATPPTTATASVRTGGVSGTPVFGTRKSAAVDPPSLTLGPAMSEVEARGDATYGGTRGGVEIVDGLGDLTVPEPRTYRRPVARVNE